MNDQLRTDLTSGADTFDLPPGDVTAVVARGRRRNRRRQRLTASTAAIAVLATAFVAVRAANDEPTSSIATEGAGAGHLGDAGIDWARAADADTAINYSYGGPTAELGGRTYALSTAPGERATDEALPRVLWRSTDGVDWEQAAGPSGFNPSRLAAGADRLYAVGTAPATAAAGGTAARVGWSDGSGPWTDQALDIDLAAIDAKTTFAYVVPTDVAAGHGAVVAAVAVGAELDVPALLPAGETAPNGWYQSADGIDVLGNGPVCPAGTSPDNPKQSDAATRRAKGEAVAGATEADAAKRAKADADAKGGATATTAPPAANEPVRTEEPQATRQFEVWCWAPDGTGSQHSPAEGRGTVAHHSFAELGIQGDVLQAVQQRPFVFRADVGSSHFERVDVPAVRGSVDLEPTDDGFVLASSDVADAKASGKAPAQVLLHSADGRSWQRDASSLPDIDGIVAMGTVDGHLGVVGAGPSGGVYAELVGGAWQTTSLTELIGAEKGSWVGAAAIGPLGVVATISESKGDEPGTTSLLASRDGSTWARTPLSDLLGGPGDVQRVVIKDDRAVVTAARRGTPAQRVSLVGTPR